VTTANATSFRLLPSRRIALLIVVAHVGAALALLTVAHDGASGWAVATLLIALGLATAWDRALLRARGSVREFSLEGPQEVLLVLHGKGRARSRVGARRWGGARLVVLPLALPTRRALLVAGDMLGAEDFRRLRLWALWGRLPGVASTPREAA
jgi:hypothetical protein